MARKRRRAAPSRRTKALAISTAQAGPGHAISRGPVPLPPGDGFESGAARQIDRFTHALIGRLTLGISPPAIYLAYADWFAHLAISPGKCGEMWMRAAQQGWRLGRYLSCAAHQPNCGRLIEPLPQDTRFDAPEWSEFPFNAISQAFLLAEQWWHAASTGVSGVARHHQNVVAFVNRQLLDMVSPSNFFAINPEVLNKTVREGGKNFTRGLANFIEDCGRQMQNLPPVGADAFKPGEQVAATPGKIVLRNRLMELIQYKPTTRTVAREPVLIVPAWIMKYYILDLSPQNSLVRWLVAQGHTVFMISWKNPDSSDRDLAIEDYIRLGIFGALDAIGEIVPKRRIHGVGYCLGGTAFAIAAAAMGRDGDRRLATLTLFAAEVDFREAGELMLFIDSSQVSFLEDLMWVSGYLDTKQMAGAFQLLRSNDLIWSRLVRDYLMGERAPMFDLMAWNADTTRMPYRMHSEYLRSLYLDNALAQGHVQIGGAPVALEDIRIPVFAVATERDHVAPWRSVYKLHLLCDTDIAFVLTSGGHNAGIVSEPGHPGRRFHFRVHRRGDPFLDPDGWRREAPVKDGSWWPVWESWLESHSSGRSKPPPLGRKSRIGPLDDAPGTYVRQS